MTNDADVERLVREHDVKIAVLDTMVRNMQSRLESIDRHISTLVWLVAAGLVGGVLNWIMRGGLGG